MNETTTKKTVSMETVFYIIGWCLICALAIASLYLKFSNTNILKTFPPCVLHTITGGYCPGCGGTRATLYFLSGHLIKAFIYHPLVFYTGVMGGWFMISQTIERISRHKFSIGMKYHDNYLWLALIIVVVNFVIKNICLFAFDIDLLAL